MRDNDEIKQKQNKMNFIAFVHVRIYQCAIRDKKECKDWKFFL